MKHSKPSLVFLVSDIGGSGEGDDRKAEERFVNKVYGLLSYSILYILVKRIHRRSI